MSSVTKIMRKGGMATKTLNMTCRSSTKACKSSFVMNSSVRARHKRSDTIAEPVLSHLALDTKRNAVKVNVHGSAVGIRCCSSATHLPTSSRAFDVG